MPMRDRSKLPLRPVPRVWAMMAGLALLSACKQPPASRIDADAVAAARGLSAMERVGCGACHEIPGLDWPKGRTGPSLVGFDDIGPIAGELANTPANLAAFVRNALDVAAYLYGIDDD